MRRKVMIDYNLKVEKIFKTKQIKFERHGN